MLHYKQYHHEKHSRPSQTAIYAYIPSMKRTVALALLLCAVATICRPQATRLFNTDHDLSSSLINQLYQDRNGMMWVATEDGLNRYDSNKFTIYRNTPGDSTSLCNNFVKSVFEDADGRLYVCTRRGVQRYYPESDSFGPRFVDVDGHNFMASVNQIVRRNDNEYWLIGDSLKAFAPTDARTIRIRDVRAKGRVIKDIHCAVLDSDGYVWLSKDEQGLFRIAPDNTVSHFFGAKDDPAVSTMTIGADGLLYAGTTSHGLIRFNRDTHSFDFLTGNTGKEVKWVFADTNGDIVQATDGDGIMVYTPATGANVHFRFGDSNFNSERQKAHCVMRDADKNLWAGLYQFGVAMIPAQANSFGYIGHKSINHNTIGSNCVSAIMRDRQGTLWVGADNDGIYTLDAGGACTSHLYNNDIAATMCLFEDSRSNIWVGTYLRGVGIIDRRTGAMRRIDVSEGPNRPGNVCFAITEDRDHNVWLGMLNSGLVKYNLATGTVVKDFPWREIIDPWIAALYYSPKTNSLYIGTYSGLQTVNNVSLAEPVITKIITEDVVYSMDEAPDGTIWLATTNGVVSYVPATGKYRRYTTADGLQSNTVYAIRHDGSHVWASLNSGLSRLDPESGVIANFMLDDGLQGNEFYKSSVFKDADTERMYFGGTGGITYFNPRDITAPGRTWTPRIAGLYVHGNPALGDKPVYETTEFRLGPDDSSFSVEFSTKELGRPESVLFAYAIDDKPWETLRAGTNIVNLHNLGAGKHSLKFKAIDSLSESETRTITILVASPWYATPWAKALYATALLMLLWWIARSYATRMRHRAELLELTHTEQINEARLQSFVNISHEIRTPMSLVISPLQKLLATDTDNGRRHEYGLILRNAKRILRLIDELMDLRKIEKRQMRLSLSRTPLVPFINDLCDTFAQVTAGKKIALTFDYDSDDTAADIDQANFDKILMNLLSNAVKYTPEGGRIAIRLASDAAAGTVTISVTDTGIGVPDAEKQRIFDRFYQAHGNSAGGTGVGLHLTYQLVALHGGTITVTDNPDGPGTCFAVSIPIEAATDNPARDIADDAFPGSRPVRLGIPLSDAKSLLVPDLDEPVEKRPAVAAAHVLIVEDDEEIRSYLAHELSEKYKVTTCANGREALEHIFHHAPDIIVSDIMMPVMDGLELTRTIKQNINLNHIPVILVTAMTRDEDNISALEAGADDYVTKPFNIEIVRSKIAGLLSRYRLLKNRYSGSQEHDDKIDRIEVASNDEKLMNRIMAVINREMANPELTVEQLASDVGLSRVHLHRKLKTLTNQSPRDFIRNTRLRQAARLLREKDLSVAEVADLTGFSNAGSFTTSFKRLFGVTPSEYSEAKTEENAN